MDDERIWDQTPCRPSNRHSPPRPPIHQASLVKLCFFHSGHVIECKPHYVCCSEQDVVQSEHHSFNWSFLLSAWSLTLIFLPLDSLSQSTLAPVRFSRYLNLNHLSNKRLAKSSTWTLNSPPGQLNLFGPKFWISDPIPCYLLSSLPTSILMEF